MIVGSTAERISDVTSDLPSLHCSQTVAPPGQGSTSSQEGLAATLVTYQNLCLSHYLYSTSKCATHVTGVSQNKPQLYYLRLLYLQY